MTNLAHNERVKLGDADISEHPGRLTLRALAMGLTACGLTCEIEAPSPDSKTVTIFAANRATTSERTRA